jgi:hypothetical protein
MRHRWIVLLLACSQLVVGCGKSAPAAPPSRNTAGLSFSLTPPEGYGLLREAERSKSWTPGGRPVPADEERIVLTRSSKVYPAEEKVRQLATDQMIRGLEGFTNVVMLETTPVTIDGLPGYESRAKALGSATNAPVRIYCCALFAADGTFYVIGYDGGEDAVDNAAKFKAAAQTVTVK